MRKVYQWNLAKRIGGNWGRLGFMGKKRSGKGGVHMVGNKARPPIVNRFIGQLCLVSTIIRNKYA